MINDMIWFISLSTDQKNYHSMFIQFTEAKILLLLSDHLVVPGVWPKAAGKSVDRDLSW